MQTRQPQTDEQIESSRACISPSPILAWSGRCSSSSALARWAHSISSIRILAGIAVFIGGFAFGHWVTNSDPAFLRILARSERYKLRTTPPSKRSPRGGRSDAASRPSHQAVEGSAALNDHINLYGFWNETTFLTKSGDLGMVLQRSGRGLREPGSARAGVCGEAAGSRAQGLRPWLPCLPVPLQVEPAGDPVRKL